MTKNTADQQDAEARQYIAFKRWLRESGGLPARPVTNDAAGMFAYIQDALWVAWSAGYKEGARLNRSDGGVSNEA
ncbi:hypothetical protein [Delftia tsuruhatensis]|uniref:hypothetical protein n=1 Tax=Delftia tsuruhatensis TaxID=180282 RepID=UPI0020286202|nr:hypothetical protein [Delftia tsuruhatensis]